MPNGRVRDARALRYTQAKQAAAKVKAAAAAQHKADIRLRDAEMEFKLAVDAAETAEEKAYLLTLTNDTVSG